MSVSGGSGAALAPVDSFVDGQPFVAAQGGAQLDPRAVKTRRAIFDAVERLASSTEGSDADLSVSNVVRLAGVSRSSFYAHFPDLRAVASGFLRETFADIADAGDDLRRAEQLSGGQTARLGYRRLVDHLVDNHAFYSTVSGLPLLREAYDEMVTVYAREIIEATLRSAGGSADVPLEVAATYVAGGALTLIRAWMQGLVDGTDDELIENLVTLLPPGLRD
jgi:AcrR family transcriptional regulator